ncbi:OsmC family protein [Dyella sp. A6]|uniref:OsmC family protein n=1 Tax=Dyella aluminiiresistens TaxID=3069105 RepID=UPI002E7857BC|nr:OsmC family protein [Dyella sp. A6]
MATSEFNLDLGWQNGFKGLGLIKGNGFDVPISIPAALGGSGTGAGPKELLASSAAACFIATLTAILESRKVPVADLAVATHAVESDDTIRLKHTAKVTVTDSATEEQIAGVEALVARADKACAVGNILRKSGVEIESHLGSVSKAG